jgi:hypothetical protein
MSTWLITSFGLPVALTTGRLAAPVLGGLPRHPLSLAALAVTLSVLVTGLTLTLVRRRRRVSGGESSS